MLKIPGLVRARTQLNKTARNWKLEAFRNGKKIVLIRSFSYLISFIVFEIINNTVCVSVDCLFHEGCCVRTDKIISVEMSCCPFCGTNLWVRKATSFSVRVVAANHLSRDT